LLKGTHLYKIKVHHSYQCNHNFHCNILTTIYMFRCDIEIQIFCSQIHWYLLLQYQLWWFERSKAPIRAPLGSHIHPSEFLKWNKNKMQSLVSIFFLFYEYFVKLSKFSSINGIRSTMNCILISVQQTPLYCFREQQNLIDTILSVFSEIQKKLW
jgi:hypothetical protein